MTASLSVHFAPFLLLAVLLGGGGGGGVRVGLRGVEGWEPKPVMTSRDLQENMYPAAGHAPCVLLLNTTGGVGCSSAYPSVTVPQKPNPRLLRSHTRDGVLSFILKASSYFFYFFCARARSR